MDGIRIYGLRKVGGGGVHINFFLGKLGRGFPWPCGYVINWWGIWVGQWSCTLIGLWKVSQRAWGGISEEGMEAFSVTFCYVKLQFESLPLNCKIAVCLTSYWVLFWVMCCSHLCLRYINDDTSIVPMLDMLRDAGRSTFLVTNR